MKLEQLKVDPRLHHNASYLSAQCRNLVAVAVFFPEVPAAMVSTSVCACVVRYDQM